MAFVDGAYRGECKQTHMRCDWLDNKSLTSLYVSGCPLVRCCTLLAVSVLGRQSDSRCRSVSGTVRLDLELDLEK